MREEIFALIRSYASYRILRTPFRQQLNLVNGVTEVKRLAGKRVCAKMGIVPAKLGGIANLRYNSKQSPLLAGGREKWGTQSDGGELNNEHTGLDSELVDRFGGFEMGSHSLPYRTLGSDRMSERRIAVLRHSEINILRAGDGAFSG